MWGELDQEALEREEHAWRREPWSSEEIEQLVVMERLHRYTQGLPCGAVALRQRLREHYSVRPLPSTRWIGQVLTRHGLTHGRTAWYEGEEPDSLPNSAQAPPTGDDQG
jgi:hypothetical protein